VSIDYQKRNGALIRRNGNIEAVREAAAKARSGEVQDLSKLNFQDLVHIENLQIDETDPLRAELDAFVDAVNNKSTPVVTAQDGLNAVEVAARIVQAIGPATLP
jgi:predicted dehydrogenase